MEELRLGRYHHAETDTNWQVVEWGSVGDLKNIDENRLTKAGLQGSEHTTFAISYPDGRTIHLTFSGVLPQDLDDVADYWSDHESL